MLKTSLTHGGPPLADDRRQDISGDMVIFVDGVPLLEWAHGGRMASAWWEHVGRILDTWSSITADVPTTNI